MKTKSRDYTTQEAAGRLWVSRKAVLQAIARGKLLAHKRGRDWFIDSQELDRWDSIRQRRPYGNPIKENK